MNLLQRIALPTALALFLAPSAASLAASAPPAKPAARPAAKSTARAFPSTSRFNTPEPLRQASSLAEPPKTADFATLLKSTPAKRRHLRLGQGSNQSSNLKPGTWR